LIGRKIGDKEVEAFKGLVPYKIVKAPSSEDATLTLPATLTTGEIDIVFSIMAPTAPRQRGLSNDGRALGLGLHALAAD
ncbi:MAG: hypothetical protein AAF360_07525, partial [Pseudomonadota bacterium]